MVAIDIVIGLGFVIVVPLIPPRLGLLLLWLVRYTLRSWDLMELSENQGL